MKLPAHIVEERDARIFAAKNRGMSYREIAQAMDISVATAHAGFIRQQNRIGKLAQEDAINGVWSHLEKLDALERPLWPLTKERVVEVDGPNGVPIQVTVPPDMNAIVNINKIMQQRAKIMGWEKEVVINQTVGAGGGNGPAIGDANKSGEITTEDLAKELASELFKNDIITGPLREQLEAALQLELQDDIEDAEVLEDTFQFELGPANTDDSALPPAWIDDDDDEYVPGAWVPDDLEDGNTQHEGR